MTRSDQLKALLKKRILVLDGAMGTALQAKGLIAETSAARPLKGATST